jgi:hypothetical protein
VPKPEPGIPMHRRRLRAGITDATRFAGQRTSPAREVARALKRHSHPLQPGSAASKDAASAAPRASAPKPRRTMDPHPKSTAQSRNETAPPRLRWCFGPVKLSSSGNPGRGFR